MSAKLLGAAIVSVTLGGTLYLALEEEKAKIQEKQSQKTEIVKPDITYVDSDGNPFITSEEEQVEVVTEPTCEFKEAMHELGLLEKFKQRFYRHQERLLEVACEGGYVLPYISNDVVVIETVFGNANNVQLIADFNKPIHATYVEFDTNELKVNEITSADVSDPMVRSTWANNNAFYFLDSYERIKNNLSN